MSRLQWIVRVVGGLLLTGAALMLVLGRTLFADRLQGMSFAIYWTWCFIVAVGALIVAAVDLWLLRRSYRRSRRELFRREFMTGEIVEQAKRRSQHPDAK